MSDHTTPTIKLGSKVQVDWEDAGTPETGTWVELPAPTWEPIMVQSVGYLIYDGPEGVMLSADRIKDHRAPATQIPRGMVRKVTVLTAGTRNARRHRPD